MIALVVAMVTSPAAAQSKLAGEWSDDEGNVYVDVGKKSVETGPDTGCAILSIKAAGNNRWRLRLSCSTADIPGPARKSNATLTLKGKTLLLDTGDGTPSTLRRQ